MNTQILTDNQVISNDNGLTHIRDRKGRLWLVILSDTPCSNRISYDGSDIHYCFQHGGTVYDMEDMIGHLEPEPDPELQGSWSIPQFIYDNETVKAGDYNRLVVELEKRFGKQQKHIDRLTDRLDRYIK